MSKSNKAASSAKNTAPSAKKPAQPSKSGSHAAKTVNWSEVTKIAAILTAICVVVTALLAGTNMLTADRIAANGEQAKANACRAVLPAEQYIELDCGYDVYLAVSGAEAVGAVITTQDKGYGGTISVMTGFDLTGRITGVNMLSHSETPGLGANSAKSAFLDQYITDVSSGDTRPEHFAVSKDGGTVDAVTAATISSRAVTRAVNTACDIFAQLSADGMLSLTEQQQTQFALPQSAASDSDAQPEQQPEAVPVDDEHFAEPIVIPDAAETSTNGGNSNG